MTDKTTKVLMLAIALGLWANAATSFLRPTDLHAAQGDGATERTLRNVADDVHKIALGLCLNGKIC